MKWLFALLAVSTFASEPLNYTRLKDLIKNNNLKSVDEVLARLEPKDFERAIPFEVSRSLQSASADNPRVVVPNADGTFVFSFTADQPSLSPKLLESNDSLEVMQFDSTRNKFFFREISFASGKATFSGEGKCLGCHKGSPNWQPFAFWPGAFGAYAKLTPREEIVLKDFVAKQSAHPRYRYILPATKKILDSGFNPFTRSLTKDFSELNARRIVHELRSLPQYGKGRFALMAAILDCPNMAAFAPQVPANSLEQLKVDTLTVNTKFSLLATQRAVEGEDPLLLKNSILDLEKWNNVIAKVRWVATNVLGTDSKHWSTAYPKGGFLFAEDGDTGLSRLLPYLNEEKAALACETLLENSQRD